MEELAERTVGRGRYALFYSCLLEDRVSTDSFDALVGGVLSGAYIPNRMFLERVTGGQPHGLSEGEDTILPGVQAFTSSPEK